MIVSPVRPISDFLPVKMRNEKTFVVIHHHGNRKLITQCFKKIGPTMKYRRCQHRKTEDKISEEAVATILPSGHL